MMYSRAIFRRNSARLGMHMGVTAAIIVLASLGIIALERHDHHTHKAPKNAPVAFKHVSHIPELAIEGIIQHGHIVEIRAKVEPDATVMVNGESAAVLWDGGEIKHFVGPLPDGVSEIAITVQNEEGGINSKQLSVVMP